MHTICFPHVEAARQAYVQAWFGFCLGANKSMRMEQLLVMTELKPYCALVRNGRDWRRFIATIPGYVDYMQRRRDEEELGE